MKKSFFILSATACLFLIVGGFFLWKSGLSSFSAPGSNETGQALGARSDIESRLPTDIPVYPSAVAKSFNETLESTQIVWETDDTATRIEAFYKNEMGKNGWERIENLSFKKEGGRQVEIQIIGKSGGKTYFTLNLNRPRP